MGRISSSTIGGPQTAATGAAEQPAPPQPTQPEAAAAGQPAATTQPVVTGQQAAERRTEAQIAGTARQGELQGIRRPPTEADILQGARRSGLTQAETTQLQQRLEHLPAQERVQEMRFLRDHVMNSPNSDRALRTYVDVQGMRETHQDRLSSDTVHTLTRSVADPRAGTTRGAEGIMGHDQAVTAARTLTEMPPAEFGRLRRTLDEAGQREGRTVRGADPQAERSLILESVAARSEALSHPGTEDRLRIATGQPSRAMADIEGYAGQVRGMRRDQLIDQSTVIDIRDDNRLGALQQRFNDSCAPTSTQIARAEADPIYARRLHQDVIHGTSTDVAASATAREQDALLTAQHGTPMPRGTPGTGVSVAGFGNMLNTSASPQTGVHYTTNAVADTPAARREALDRMDQALRRGQDVPIGVHWNEGGGHAMMVTDVRGQGDNRRFLVTDPWDGRTSWVSARSLVAGDTTLIQGPPRSRGDLISTYE